MPDENLTLNQLRDEIVPLARLLGDPQPGIITYHLAVAKAMDHLVELWGDRYTPPVALAPETYEGLIGKWIPSAPNLPLKVMQVGTETVLINDEDTIVMSKTNAGKRYYVTLPHCECAGFQFRGKCRHISVAQAAREQYRKDYPGQSKAEA